ncbi:MAG: hypothetical protein JNL50_03985 [Phycisphaerae bacterium]|nr:hypothetical protein [Phycisphaerae bacterium]
MEISIRHRDGFAEAPDPVRRMMEITESGHYCCICYEKSRGITHERVVEPMHLVDGASGLLVRAIQIEPERGLRCFAVSKIVSVGRHERPLPPKSRARNTFSSGEVRRLPTPSVLPKKESHSRSPWASTSFTQYLMRLREALVDGRLDGDEIEEIAATRVAMSMQPEQVAAAHAYLLGEELLAMSIDGQVDDQDWDRFRAIRASLRTLGWQE